MLLPNEPEVNIFGNKPLEIYLKVEVEPKNFLLMTEQIKANIPLLCMESIIAQIHQELCSGINEAEVKADRQALLYGFEMSVVDAEITLLIYPKRERHLQLIKAIYTRLAQMFSTQCAVTPTESCIIGTFTI